MEVEFRSRFLERCFTHSSEAMRAWGREVGLRYVHRIQLMKETEMFEDLLRVRFLRVHPLSGVRRGQHALNLTGRWRLVVSVQGGAIMVEEVSNHYDD